MMHDHKPIAVALEQPKAKPGRVCPECAVAVDVSKDWRVMFCSAEHRTAFHNRQTVRGRKLVPLVMAERITRSGYCRDKATGILARQRSRQLMDLWAREDREAKRMPMDTYVALRERLGFNDADVLTEAQTKRKKANALERLTDEELLGKIQRCRSDAQLEKLRAERRRRQEINQGAPINA